MINFVKHATDKLWTEFVFSASGREKTKLCSQRVCCMLYKVYHALTSAALCLYPCLSYNWNFQSLSTTFHYFFSASPLCFVYLCLYFLMFSNFDSSPASGPERGIRAPNGFGPRKGDSGPEREYCMRTQPVCKSGSGPASGLPRGIRALKWRFRAWKGKTRFTTCFRHAVFSSALCGRGVVCTRENGVVCTRETWVVCTREKFIFMDFIYLISTCALSTLVSWSWHHALRVAFFPQRICMLLLHLLSTTFQSFTHTYIYILFCIRNISKLRTVTRDVTCQVHRR